MKYNKTIQKIGKSFLKFFESFCSPKMLIFYHYCTDNARLFFFNYYFLYNFLIIYEYYINILFTIKHIAQNIFIIFNYNIAFYLAICTNHWSLSQQFYTLKQIIHNVNYLFT